MHAPEPAGTFPPPQERALAALSHAAILLPLVGAVLALAATLALGRQRRFLRFQATQAVIFHLVNWLPMTLVPLIMAAPMVASGFVYRMPDGAQKESLATLFGILFLAIWFFALAFAPILIGWCLVFCGVGLFAAWRAGAGRRFHYPLLGAWLAAIAPPD